MGQTVTEKILAAHLLEGELVKGREIGIRIDQTLTQDATGTMAYLEFEAIGIPRVKTELSVCYVDHNLIQSDFRNADDHRFLQSVARKYGLYFSPPGNGISHQVHLERFGLPGKTLLGSDSHTPTGGGLGMLAMGAGGLDVAMAMAGRPFYLVMPRIYGIKLTGRLSPWVSARDVLLEVLRRLSVKGGVGYVMEYFGPGVAENLGLPHVTEIRRIEEVAEERTIVVERLLEDGYLRLKTTLPVILTVVKEINEPRLPSLKGKMAAKKAQVAVWSAADLELDTQRIGLTGSPTQVMKIFTPSRPSGGKVFEGDVQSAVAQLLSALRDAGLPLGRKGEA